MTFFVNLNMKNAENMTKDKLEIIESALENYVKVRGKLPCPSSRTESFESANLGLDSDCTLLSAPAGTVDFLSADSDIRIGAIPVRELNLDKDLLFDGWRNRFTYAVAKDLAKTSESFRDFSPTGLGALTIKDKNGNTINSKNNVAYVITSHGPKGLGAFNIGGVQRTACPTPIGGENCNDDDVFIDAFLYPTHDNPNMVKWKTRNYLIKSTALIAPLS
jgi:hypothetical protein